MPRSIQSLLIFLCCGLVACGWLGCSSQKKGPLTIADMLARARTAKSPEGKARELVKVAVQQAATDKAGSASTLAEALSTLPPDGQPLACVPVLVDIATTYCDIGQRSAAQKAVTMAMTLTEQVTDPLGRTQLLAQIGTVQGSRETGLGDVAAAKTTLAQASRMATADVAERFRGKALAAVASGYAEAGLAAEAKDMIGTLEELARGLDDLRPKAEAFAAAASVRAAAGDKEAAAGLLAEAAKAAKSIDDFPANRAYALIAVAKAYRTDGDLKGALALLADAEKAASKVGDPQQQKDALRAIRQLQAKLE
jgi:tetratricopeptide (TPR) repeat protein